MRRLKINRERWRKFADRHAVGWSDTEPFASKAGTRYVPAPRGLVRAWLRHDQERLRRNLRSNRG
jgi:hypothetical protein